ncbi:MAG: hypothetical protein HQK49_10185 [Oligoflexia bacterium]|nr:hypothetical protein [Oligoflexia bacterium]
MRKRMIETIFFKLIALLGIFQFVNLFTVDNANSANFFKQLSLIIKQNKKIVDRYALQSPIVDPALASVMDIKLREMNTFNMSKTQNMITRKVKWVNGASIYQNHLNTNTTKGDQNKDNSNNELKIFTADELQILKQLAKDEKIFVEPFFYTQEQIESGIENGMFDNSFIRALKNKIEKLENIDNGTNETLGDVEATENSNGQSDICPQLNEIQDVQKLNNQNQKLSNQLTKLNSMLEKIQIRKEKSMFPENVYLRSKQQNFTGNFLYCLGSDNKIYVKPNLNRGNNNRFQKGGEWEKNDDVYIKNNPGNRDGWNLHDGTGGPTLPDGEKIVEFDVQGEIVVALTNKGNFHLYKPNNKKLPTAWNTRSLGVPHGVLKIPKEDVVGWSFSIGLANEGKEWRRRTKEFMHDDDIVGYFKDSKQDKQIYFGFTPTVYVLLKNGSIVFWDTGLAPEFTRGILIPMENGFKAENISTAGSTIFVSGKDKDGKNVMYTRMFDYEINGTPTHNLTYDQVKASSNKNNSQKIYSLYTERSALLDGWKKHQSITTAPETGHINEKNNQAAISGLSKISIHTTGLGDDNRELRVVGVNSRGEMGFYHKKISEDEWLFNSFSAAEIKKSLILSSLYKNTFSYPYIKSDSTISSSELLKDYPQGTISGVAKLGDLAEDIKVEMQNFNIFQTPDQPSTIKITTKSGKTIDLKMRTSDEWSLTTLSKSNPQLIGKSEGTPKVLKCTLDISEEYLNSNDNEVKVVIDIFRKYHLKSNAFSLIANNEKIEIDSHADLKMRFKREDNDKSIYTDMIDRPELIVNENDDLKTVEKKMIANQEMLARISDEQSEVNSKSKNIKNALLWSSIYAVSKLVNSVVSPVSFITANNNVSAKDDKSNFVNMVKTVVDNSSRISSAYAKLNIKQLFKNRKSNKVDEAEELLKNRISKYQEKYNNGDLQ